MLTPHPVNTIGVQVFRHKHTNWTWREEDRLRSGVTSSLSKWAKCVSRIAGHMRNLFQPRWLILSCAVSASTNERYQQLPFFLTAFVFECVSVLWTQFQACLIDFWSRVWTPNSTSKWSAIHLCSQVHSFLLDTWKTWKIIMMKRIKPDPKICNLSQHLPEVN